MRILALTNLYPSPIQPNRAAFNRQQFRTLAEEHALQVIAPIAWTDELAAIRSGKSLAKNRRTINDGLTVEHPRYYFPPMVGRRWYGKFFELSAAKAFDRAIEEFCPDIVFAPWAYPDGWAAVRLARRHGLPVVVKCHGSDILALDEYPSRKRPTVHAVRSADGVVAVSRHLGDRLLQLGVERDRLRVIIDGVDRKVFHPGSKDQARRNLRIPDGPPVVLFVGNLVPVKGVDVLLSACRILAEKATRVRLSIIGEGPLRKALEGQVAEFGLEGCVEFKGTVPHGSLPDWYRACDLFVLPSRSEGVPSVLLEASECGTPWVASAVGGIPEIVDLGRSRLVSPNAPGELADAICESINRPPATSQGSPRSIWESVNELSQYLEETRDRAAAAA